jgi:hypothetical protein
MLTDEQLEDLLRFEFRAGGEPDASRVIDAVTREVARDPLHLGIRRAAVSRDEDASSAGSRRRTFVHRWRLALPAGAAIATTSLLAGLGVFSSGPAALSMETVAYRTTGAVTTAASAEIAYAQTVVTNPSGGVAGNYDWWSEEGNGRVEQLSADGSPVTDTSWYDANGTLSGREVDYATRTWHATNGGASRQSPLGDFSDELALGEVIQNQLSSGRSENVQSTTLNGEPVLELSGTVEIYHASATKIGASGSTAASGSSGTAGDSGTGAAAASAPSAASSKAAAAARAVASGATTLTGTTTNWTVWVDPTSYLPVQMVETAADGTTATSSIEWLAPSSTDLGQLVAPIPSGFAEVAAPAGQAGPTGNSGS